MGTGSFPGIESGRSVTLTPHPLRLLRSKNSVLSLRAFVAYEKGETKVPIIILETITYKESTIQ
jgi:hypothetical protein